MKVLILQGSPRANGNTACARIIRKNYNGYEKTIFMPHGNDGRADPFGTKCI